MKHHLTEKHKHDVEIHNSVLSSQTVSLNEAITNWFQVMVTPEEREGRLENDPNLSRSVTPANATVNTRKGGQESGPEQQKVWCRPAYKHSFNPIVVGT